MAEPVGDEGKAGIDGGAVSDGDTEQTVKLSLPPAA